MVGLFVWVRLGIGVLVLHSANEVGCASVMQFVNVQ
jgi:hypothetical protein